MNRFRIQPKPGDTIVELKVRVLLNPEKSEHWSLPEDHVREIAGHNYVQSVEVIGETKVEDPCP